MRGGVREVLDGSERKQMPYQSNQQWYANCQTGQDDQANVRGHLIRREVIVPRAGRLQSLLSVEIHGLNPQRFFQAG